jgi:uncharacterized integral membrane protein
MNYKLIVIVIISSLALLFILQNISPTEIQFLFWSTRMPRALLIVLLLLAGFLLGWLANGYRHIHKGRATHATSREEP